ncbi:MAG: NfeD family protein [Promethearchaeia archaeon]
MDLYDIFFNICLGLFIGGIIFSIISIFLAHMEAQSGGAEVDTDVDIDADVDVDIDADVDVDVDIDVDIDVDVDLDVGAEFDVDAVDVDADLDVGVDVDAEVDVELDIDTDVDVDIDSDIDVDTDAIGTTTTPAPIMLLISAYLLVFGMTGILFSSIPIDYRFITFIITPIIAFISAKYLNIAWKKIAKSKYYKISSTQNLIGKEAEVVSPVDKRGGVVRINSNTPMKYEKVHVKPVNDDHYFDRGTKVYIVDVKGDFLLVDINKKIIKKK